jgi:threonine/homoserine/homoserine lactone efflux protein
MELLITLTGIILGFITMVAVVTLIINATLSRHRKSFKPVHAAIGCPLSYLSNGCDA